MFLMSPRSSLRSTYYVVAILLLPLVALWRHDDPLFSPLWQSDPWFYLGYFRDLVNFKRDLFPGLYYGSRLSWILPGWLAHRILPPLFANAVLHLGVHTVATVSLFWILRTTAGVRAAFLTAILFSTNPWFWCATGWDHVTGAAIAYLLLGMACLAAAAEMPSRGWLPTLAGMSLTGAVIAHLFLAAFVPLVLLYYAGMVWARQDPLKPTLSHAALWLAAGFLVLTVPLCAINGFLIDGNFWFWSPSFRTASAVVHSYAWPESIWREHRLVPWLWLPIASAAVAVISVCGWRGAVKHRDVAGLIASAQLLLAIAFMAAMQVRGITLLGHYYYACYLFPFAFLVIGHSFWRAAEKMQARTYMAACAAVLVLAAAAWYDPASHPAPGRLAWLLAAAFGALAASLALRKWPAGVFFGIAGFVVLMFATYNGSNQSGRLHATRAEYQRVMDARQRIEKRRGDSPILFWYDKEEPAFHEYFALNGTYISEFARIGEHFPSGCPERADKGTMVVASSWRKGAAEIARSALDRCWSGTGLKAVINDTFVGSQAPNPYAISLLGAENDYSVLRPLSVSLGLSPGKGVLRLSPNATQDEPLPLDLWYPIPGTLQSATFEGIEVQTPRGGTAYSMTYPALVVPATGRYRFVLRYSPRSGQFAFGAFPADESRWLAVVQSPRTWGKHGQEAAFALDLNQGDSVTLRIANSNSKDRPSSFTIEDVMVYLFAPAR
jgi:hypothetical protein